MLVLAVLCVASFSKLGEFQHTSSLVAHRHQVRFALEQTSFAASDAQAAVRGDLIANKPDFLTPYDDAKRKFPALLADLSALVSDNPEQQSSMLQLSDQVVSFIALMPRADLALLHQLWTNLISNAVKCSSKNPQTEVHVSGLANQIEATYLVRDNWSGYDMTYYDKVFGVVQRLHPTEAFAGTGVWLAIVHRIITRHRGRILAESDIGKGSTFFFALPHKEAV